MKQPLTCLTLALVFAATGASAAALPESAKIDEILAKEWQKYSLQPNEKASDEVFLRRIYVDVVGRIPTIDEAKAFLASTDKDKRANLIDQLLGSDGYVANYFNYFADILRLQTDTKGALTGYAYADWLKSALKKNQPWDGMVRELLTTDGSSWDSGAIGFYMRDQGMQLDHLAATVQVFLGTQIVCAQCHNHPFDKWTQMDYYHMAAFTYGMDSKKGYNLNFGKMGKEGKNSPDAQTLRRDLKSVQESIKEVGKVLRYTTITETNRLPKLPHDYKYSDAKPNEEIQPKSMFGEAVEQKEGESRIDAFARWMTAPANPRFTVVIANRLWKRAMGMGLIEPVDEMTDSTAPSNGELMSYLEKLMADKKYDMKAYLRVIFNSDTYQRMPSKKDVALGETYHFTGPLMRRLSAEQVWDSVATLIKGNIDDKASEPNYAAERKLDALGKLYDTLSSKDPRQLVEDIKSKGGAESPEKLAKIKELTDKANELRRAGNKEEASKLQKQVSSLRNSGRKDAFAAVLGEEGAREFQRDYREGGVKAKGGKEKDGLVRASLSRAEIEKIMADAGGDKKKARELIDAAQKRNKVGLAMVNGATRASDLPSPSPRGHMLRIFGQSDRETIENASREAAVPQALALLNGPVADALVNDNSDFSQQVARESTNDAKMDAVFLGLLSRRPTADEKKIIAGVMTERGDNAKADVVHALLNTGEFLFVK
ncbi:MAG: DUF1549 and DUF1553 domain-containing protein [Verrucomicrobiaceae bacterium]|nr:DUF1549 and DUF1553 domain-containing protein [Verrucomicrobiaceae bacterium]